MYGLLSQFDNYYYFIIGLQAVCVFHAMKNGNQGKWIYLIVFLPVIGCLIYLFTEVINKRHVSSIQSDVVNIVNPGARIKELERKFKFSETLANRQALADAYLEKGLYEQAIDLYEPALTGLFENNEHIINQLIRAYFAKERYEDILRIAPRIAGSFNFSKNRSALLYALALEKSGKAEEADKQFKALNHRFSNYEARYNYGQFLIRSDRIKEADSLFSTIVNEASQMSRKDMRDSKVWIDKAAKELNNLPVE
ncbi:hypothetical protein [Desertivirga arenae]|uniref:hypothetical protein n=1 Tax=Desertivirga arenae TaxID=2810309 RepID=UPI001A962761|nr:hypothetical protein [Pedobacter sp. SYSU D00823]